MGDSKIEWTNKTWNPVTGCTKVSTGCKHCYAERLFPRVYGNTNVRDVSESNLAGEPIERKRRFTDVACHPERLEQPLHWKKPQMVFVNSMSDLFHEDIPFEFIGNVFATMLNSQRHIYQILTKRPKRMKEFCDWLYGYGNGPSSALINNIWLGISCENQETANERIPILLQVPAAVRFLSCEPLLASIDLNQIWAKMPSGGTSLYNVISNKSIDWVIVGGESGPEYRAMLPYWARDIRDQCKAAGVPFFFKQTAGKKEIPEDLKIREYPGAIKKL